MRKPIIHLLDFAACGPRYQLEFQNANSITYWFGPARPSMQSVQGLAQWYCALRRRGHGLARHMTPSPRMTGHFPI